MESLVALKMPLTLPLWGLASFKITREELRALLGEPHFVETDPRRPCGGQQDSWAYRLQSGQRLLIIFDVTISTAELVGDPPDLVPITAALGLSADDPRLDRHTEPCLLQ
jgi:hypothetical protein